MIQLKIEKEFFSLPNFSLSTLFKKLTPKNIVYFMAAILLER